MKSSYPDYEFAALTPNEIQQSFLANGCCLLRKAIPVSKILKRAEEVEFICERRAEKVRIGEQLDVMQRFHITEQAFKEFYRRKSLYDLLGEKKWKLILEAIFGKKKLFSKKTYHQHPETLTRGIDSREESQRDLTSFRPLAFHLDALYHNPHMNFTVNCWVPFNDCGVDAPSLQVIPVNHLEMQKLIGLDDKADFSQKDRWSTTNIWENYIPDKLKAMIWRPTFEVGDVLLMNSWLMHASYSTPEMTQSRRSVEIRHYSTNDQPELFRM